MSKKTFAIITDIHSNTESLKTALSIIENRDGVDQIMCLGDCFPLGPNPEDTLELLNSIKNSEPGSIITNLQIENNINTFFRLSNNTIIDRLREKFPELSINPSQKEVFLLLRQLRNKW